MRTGGRRLPQLEGELFVTDGGLETALIYHHGFDLPEFAAFPLVETDEGREALRAWFRPFIALAREQGVGVLIDTATWRANADWGAKLGYSAADLDRVNVCAVELAEELRRAEAETPALVSGSIGPRGDGYVVGDAMTADDAEAYHAVQIGSFARTSADMVTAYTLTYAEEAIGIVRAASTHDVPAAVSFTVETDGRLPSGQTLGDAVTQTDAETGNAAAYFLVNCAHPTHFTDAIEDGAEWVDRIVGLRANASTKSHAELDASDELDDGDPHDLGNRYGELRTRLPNVTVVGGCCGTDLRHVAAACIAWSAEAPTTR